MNINFTTINRNIKRHFLNHINSKNLQQIFIFIFCVLIFFHGFYYAIHQQNKKRTVGTDKKIDVVLNFDNFASGKFQNDLEAFLKNTGVIAKSFKKPLNLCIFKLFSSTNSGIFIGINDELFEKSYLIEKFAVDSAKNDDKFIKNHVEKIKRVQNILAKHNIKFVYIFAPSKADFREDKIPAKFSCLKNQETEGNRSYVRLERTMRKNNVYFIDANRYLLENKNNQEYPFFPRYGIHWSDFGFYHFVKNKIFDDVFDNELQCELYASKKPLNTDADLGGLVGIKRKHLKYTKLAYIKDCKLSKPNDKKILLIGDSFTDIFAANHDFQDMFRDDTNNFRWWYYKDIYSFDGKTIDTHLSAKEKMAILKKKDVVLFVATTPNLFNENLNRFFDDVLNNFK